MKPKLAILIILTLLLFACGSGTPTSVIRTPTVTQPLTDTPTQTLTPLPLLPTVPTSTPFPLTPPNSTLYPTASVVKANTIAFISGNSLWVANIDGSGERKLVDIEANTEPYALIKFSLSWSPDGKWIGYMSANELWVISPDGLIKRKILSTQDTNHKLIRMYKWSPDSSKVAYIQANRQDKIILVGLVDLATGKVYELSSYPPTRFTLYWSPNGQYLLLDKESSFFVFEVSTREFVKEIKTIDGCLTSKYTELAWSPNSKWFYHVYHGDVESKWICISGLDGSNWQIPMRGLLTLPAWDKTGKILYFAAKETTSNTYPDATVVLQLLGYDVRTRELRHLGSLGKYPQQDVWSMFMSPNQNILALQACTKNDSPKCSFIIMNAQSLSVVNKFTVDFQFSLIRMYDFSNPFWSSDNRNIILFARGRNPLDGRLNYYSSFYAVDTKTGKAIPLSGRHLIDIWTISPIATTP